MKEEAKSITDTDLNVARINELLSENCDKSFRMFKAIQLARINYRQKSADHRAWVIDQMVRILVADIDNYDDLIFDDWDTGIEPRK